MSREFGEYMGGYFHTKVRFAADDALNGSQEITRLWGSVLDSLAEVAYAIASAEANDSGPDYPIFESLAQLPRIRNGLQEIESYLEPFRRVAEEAVRRSLTEQANK